MARKQAVQLQADLQNNDDFEKFLETPGLLVIDVYSEWCGPCLGMQGGLRKLKLEQGELLNLAIAKSDTISYINRFYKKSEPTWLFVAHGRATNIMFGSDSPKLLKLISDETRSLSKLKERETYSVTEMQPKEIELDSVRNAAARAKAQKEHAENERKKTEYFNFVTSTIHKNLPEIGITIFGPHIHRDTHRQLIDYAAERFGMQCKDRRSQVITKEQFDFINAHCENPLGADVIEALEGKELFVCFWRVDDTKESVLDVLHKYVDSIVKIDKKRQENEDSKRPFIADTKVVIPYELPADEECPFDEQQESIRQDDESVELVNESEDISEGGELDNDEGMLGDEMLMVASGVDLVMVKKEKDSISRNSQHTVKEKKIVCMRNVTIPAVWLPKDWRTHAAIIYLLFHPQTSSFLPPDPVPEPPHVIMAFDAFKRHDLIEFAERNMKDIPLYGFFTSDEPDEAKYIASSKQIYAHHRPVISDKLIFKVNKSTSHTMLALATFGPTYVSANTSIGAQDAKIFFPEGFISAEQQELEAKKSEAPKGKKRAKSTVTGKLKAQDSHEKHEAEPEAAPRVSFTRESNTQTEFTDPAPIVEEGKAGDLAEGAAVGVAVEAAVAQETHDKNQETIPQLEVANDVGAPDALEATAAVAEEPNFDKMAVEEPLTVVTETDADLVALPA